MDTLRELAQKIIDLSPQIPAEASFLVRSIDEPGVLADIVSSNLNIAPDEKQDLLETFDTHERMQKVIALLNKEIQVLELSNKIQTEVKGEMDKAQREYFLREQLKAIQKELGEVDERQEEFEELKRSIKRAKMPQGRRGGGVQGAQADEPHEPRRRRVHRQPHLHRLALRPAVGAQQQGPPRRARGRAHPRRGPLRPRQGQAADPRVPRGAQAQAGHEGAHPLPGRPPGVGKTSLAKSVARALGSQDGAHRPRRRARRGRDPRPPADLHRLHAGQDHQGAQEGDTNNPVFVLDEIDKLGADYRGDPSSALLEVLDPEQNDTFTDHYLDVAFDLSKVLFIATANVPDTIPGPLRDRMEIIRIAGYTHNEKDSDRAKRYLWPESASRITDLTSDMVTLPEETLDKVIESYTREAGVPFAQARAGGDLPVVGPREIASEKRESGFEVTPELSRRSAGPSTSGRRSPSAPRCRRGHGPRLDQHRR